MHQQKGFKAFFYHNGLKVYVGRCATREDAKILSKKKKEEFLKDPSGWPLHIRNKVKFWQYFACSDELAEMRQVRLSDIAGPEVAVRLAVLEQAIFDMKYVGNWVRDNYDIRKDALEWINSDEMGEPSFTFKSIVEDILGVDAEQARNAILKGYKEYMNRNGIDV